MLNKPTFPFGKIGFILTSVLALCLFSGESLAQNEQEKPIEVPRQSDRPVVEEDGSFHHNFNSDQNDIKANAELKVSPVPIPTTPIRREVVIGPEGKKSSEPSSTLSFNIFLYVLEKFKAD
ncbi:hypothetical protein OU792_13340 [Algoriphagus sp. NF]|jgi:hypothetical protein|uniref:Uncharacterized protein n=1 Tax=Algoriphagus formosus TaxID=2007308 RepID=A0A4R5UY36_9BACT|nr:MULTISPECIES: hypothetical protein [Algoriphagus]MDE0560978.1 hypothetical protein [Algoriphagus sp. NF]TDK44284.1 hypothetical protein E1898_11470 [Algoriphagus aquimaris]